MKDKKILITGGAGFIGSNLTLALQEQFPENEYTVIDDFSCGTRDNLRDVSARVIQGDVVVMDLHKEFPGGVDAIFHQAAITDTTVQDREKMFRQNVGGFQNVFALAKKSRATFVYASSAAVYGASPSPMREGQGEAPLNVYGESKLEVDRIVREEMSVSFGMTIVGLRYFNVYGPREAHKGNMASMIWQLCRQMREGRHPRVFEFGEQRRDFIYVKDVVAANILALNAPRSCIVNVGTGKSRSFNDIIATLNELLGTNLAPEYFANPYAAAYQEDTEADITQAKELLGYEPRYELEAGMEDYLGKTP